MSACQGCTMTGEVKYHIYIHVFRLCVEVLMSSNCLINVNACFPVVSVKLSPQDKSNRTLLGSDWRSYRSDRGSRIATHYVTFDVTWLPAGRLELPHSPLHQQTCAQHEVKMSHCHHSIWRYHPGLTLCNLVFL